MDLLFAVKVLNESTDTATVGGYGVIFGGSDFYGETFTSETDFGPFVQGNDLPVYYDHTLETPQHPLGNVIKAQPDDKGLWIEAQLRKSEEYTAEVLKLIQQGVLGWSSGSAPHLVRYADDQKTIKQWHVIEMSLTPTPAEPRTVGVRFMKNQKERTVRRTSSQMAARIDALEARLKAMQEEPPPQNVGGTLVPEDRSKRAFRSYMVRGIKADLQEDVGSEGGFLVPTSYNQGVVIPLTENSVLRRSGASVVQLGGGSGAHRVPTMTLSNPAQITPEEGDYATDAPSLGQVELRPYKFTRMTRISEELLDDSRVDVVNDVIAPDAGRAFAQAENEKFLTGTGSGEPQGILYGLDSTYEVATGSAGAIDYDDVTDVFYTLPVTYRDRARWIVSDDASKALRKLKDGAGRPIWEPSMQVGQPDMLFGRPVLTTGHLPQVATGNTVMIFGDFSFFWIAEFSNLAVQRLDQLYAATGQIGFRWYRRMDSKVMLKEAFASLKVS